MLDEGDREKGKTTLPIVSTGDLVAPGVDPSEVELPKFAPDELIGLNFLRQTPDGQRVWAQVLQKVNDFESLNHKNLKFLLKLGDGDLEELIGYNELSHIIEQQVEAENDNPDNPWMFKEILNHSGPLRPSDPTYKGSSWNVRVLWDDGSETDVPLGSVIDDDAITDANYAVKNDLISRPGWT